MASYGGLRPTSFLVVEKTEIRNQEPEASISIGFDAFFTFINRIPEDFAPFPSVSSRSPIMRQCCGSIPIFLQTFINASRHGFSPPNDGASKR